MRTTGTLIVFLSTIALATAARAEVMLDTISPKLSVGASLRTRWEGWNWFDPHGFQNNDYDFIGTMARAGVRWKDDPFEAFVEVQNSALIDVPTTATAPAPQGVLGLGGTYYVHNRARNDASVFLKQGFVLLKQLGVPGLTFKGGRFEFSEGNEVLSGEPTMDWIKNARISQRLIGSFAWSDVGRAFDGGVLAFNRSPFNVTMMLSHPTQGGFDLNGMKELSDVDVGYAAVNFTKLRASSTSDIRLFYVYYGDRRDQVKTDNRPLPVRQGPDRKQQVGVHTQGVHLAHVQPTAIGTFDGLVWGAIQQGDWGDLSHSGWAWDAEVGYQPTLPGKPWLRIGMARSSGDDNPGDDQHETFFQILPTARVYSFSTFYNLMNSEDGFAEVLLRPLPRLVSRTEFHNLRVTEGRDLWYQGSGATLNDSGRPEGFGFAGRPAGGHRDLFQIAQTSLSYDWNAWINTNIYYAHAFGGRIVSNIYRDHDADFGYLEVTLKL